MIFCVAFASEELKPESTHKSAINRMLKSKKPQEKLDLNDEKPPVWVHSIGLLTVYFDDGTLKQGFGALLREGHFITTADLVQNGKDFPKNIYVKMQDDSAKPLICVAKLEISALDTQKGLALLKTISYTDEYCNVRDESFYHKRIFNLYYLDIFAHRVPMNIAYDISKLEMNEKMLFPLIKGQYTFSSNSINKQKHLFYYDKKLKRNLFYAYGIARNFDVKMGNPFFDEKGNLVGIYTRTAYYNEPVIVHENIIKSFLCNLQADFKLYTWNERDCKIFQYNLIENMKDIVQDSGH